MPWGAYKMLPDEAIREMEAIRKEIERIKSFDVPKNDLHGSFPPSLGYHERGERCWNTAPSSGGYVGWVCTATGTPGTWKGFGLIA